MLISEELVFPQITLYNYSLIVLHGVLLHCLTFPIYISSMTNWLLSGHPL